MTLLQDRPDPAANAAAAAGAGSRAAATPGPGPSGPQGPGGDPHAVVRFVGSLAAALDRLQSTPAWSMTPDEQRHALVELRKQHARLRELELRVLVAGDRNDIGADSGATSTASWLAHETRTTRPARFADVHLARALDEEFDATRRALAAGEIDVEKAAIIIKAVDELSDDYDELPPGTRVDAEAHLVDLAKQFDAAMLRKLGKRLFEVVCPHAADEAEGRKLAEEEERARRAAFVTMRDNGDGTAEGRFRLPALHAGLLRKALQSLTAPRRIGEGRFDPETGKKLPASTLLGQGFMDLLENHLSLDTLPSRNGSPFRLVVTVPLEHLRTGLGVATTDVGVRISAGEARRLACKAGILPMVLNGESVPLDLGREKRLFDKYQTTALDHVYGGCAAANCDRPPAWVEYHHKRPWAKGGDTDAENGIPLCPPHHHMADHPEHWNMHTLPDGRVRFHRRT